MIWTAKFSAIDRAAVLAALLALGAFALSAAPARAWEKEPARRFAEIALAKMPEGPAAFLKSRKADYINGALAGESLWDAIYEGENAQPHEADFYDAAVKSVAFQYRRASSALYSKAPPDQTALELGLLVRLAMECLEPYPDFKEFRFAEIAGTRPFFEADAEQALEKFDFLFDGATAMKAPIDRLLEVARKNQMDADVIYESYRKGDGFKPVADRTTAALNRSLNFAVDAVVSVWEGSAYKGGPAVNVREVLGLDTIHKESEAYRIETPMPPAPPKTETPQAKKNEEPKKEEKKEK